MSSTPVNLNKARKAANRTARKLQADENTVKFGRSKAERDAIRLRVAQDARRLDGKKRAP